MKAPVFSLALAVSMAPFLSAAEVEAGASLEEVRAVLGTPKGQAVTDERHVIYYERGEIELRDGRVVRVALRTPEEHAAQVARDERLRVEQEARRAQLVAEGTALRDRKLADASFLAAPVAFQVTFWENFARSYPGVSCAEPLTIARLRLNEQLEEKLRKNEEITRLAELEARDAAAEREKPVYYHIGYSPYRGGRGHDRYRPFGLGTVNYTYYDAPRPVYTTPTSPVINPFSRDPAQPERRDYRGDDSDSSPGRWGNGGRPEQRGHHGHRDWSGADSGHRRDKF